MSSNKGMTRSQQTAQAGRQYGGETQAERVARRRQQFLDAGLTVFGTTGYRAATVRQLCRQAELTDRYFYESFQGLEDLLVAVYLREFDQLQHTVLQAMEAGLARQDPMGAVRDGLHALLDMASDPRVARVCWLEVLGVSPRVDAVYIETFQRFADLVMAFARQHFPDMAVAEAEVRMVGIALVGAVSQTVTHWLLSGCREERQTLVSASERIFRGVMATIEQPSNAPLPLPATRSRPGASRRA